MWDLHTYQRFNSPPGPVFTAEQSHGCRRRPKHSPRIECRTSSVRASPASEYKIDVSKVSKNPGFYFDLSLTAAA